MARWDEKNAKVRTDAYEKDGLDGGEEIRKAVDTYNSSIFGEPECEVIDAYGYIANIANDNQAEFLSEFERDTKGEEQAMDDDVMIIGSANRKKARKLIKAEKRPSELLGKLEVADERGGLPPPSL
ncbi:hypothetical protein E2562_021020 [Oryza meyeriana var. granulata]|uniref:Uncharacterized protein n=1 Tax=Oryza meyeriana var. granulata TaxID=110450 RepID=A0A6G1FAK1_9ORYZ|nr:hypothetical protein E2562_021020 [Oryza meyeriana var. granulata]